MGQGLEDVTDAAVFKALLREALHRRVALVVDVFKDFDKGDGNIDKKGFKKALRRLGLSEATPRKLVNALWGSWDADCSGSLGIAELRKVLRSERKGGDGIMSDDAAALLESRAREAKRQALKDQAAARRAMIQAAERNAQANKQQMEALNRVESLYRDLGVHGKDPNPTPNPNPHPSPSPSPSPSPEQVCTARRPSRSSSSGTSMATAS